MIRWADDTEAKAVLQFFESWQHGLGAEVVGDREIAIAGDAVVLVSPDHAHLPPELWENADHAGLRIGTWEDGFHLDLQGALRAAVHTRKQCIRVSEQAARMFIYGKPILGDSVKNFDPTLNRGDACIVCNPRWEALGIGLVRGKFKGALPVVEAVHDLGAYLRDQA